MEKTDIKYYFIVNPYSRTGSGLKIWKKIREYLQSAGIPHQAFQTKYRGHASEIAARLTAPSRADGQPIRIVVLGGDGTLNEVLNGVHISDQVSLGYIPAGSGGDFSRDMKMPNDPITALKQILDTKSGQETFLDYGVLTIPAEKIKQSKDSPGSALSAAKKTEEITAPSDESCTDILSSKTDNEASGINSRLSRRFLVSAGTGYDASVCEHINRSRFKNLFNLMHISSIAYTLIGIIQIAESDSSDGMLILEGEMKIPLKKIRFISAHIHKYEGGGYPFAPDADPADGYLDLCVIAGASRVKFVPILFSSIPGKHTRFKKNVQIYRCRKAEIHTGKPLWIHTDGEVDRKAADIQISCETQRLKFIV